MKLVTPSGFALIVATAFHPAAVYSLPLRTFVSSFGKDAKDCSRAAPCRSFAAVIDKTESGGEINTLDPGGYGSLAIHKPISIVSGLGEAGMLVPANSFGIFVYVHAGEQVNLRGLAIEGAGVGKTGAAPA